MPQLRLSISTRRPCPAAGTVFSHKPTFMKQRALRFFPPTAYGASFLAQEMPLILACSIIFSSALGLAPALLLGPACFCPLLAAPCCA